MAEKKNKCPLCNKKLVMKDGVPACPDCGYRDPYRSGSGQAQTDYSRQSQINYGQSSQAGGIPQPNYGQSPQAGGIPQPNYGQSPQANSIPQPNYGQSSQAGRNSQPNYGQSSQAGGNSQPNHGQQAGYGQSHPNPGSYADRGKSSESSGKKKGANTAVVVIIVVAIAFVAVSIAGMARMYFFPLFSNIQDGSGYQEASSAPAASSVTGWQESSVSSLPERDSSSVSHLVFDPPESELLKEFVSQLFDKPASSVTREDLNSVIRVEIRDMHNYNGTEVTYELSDGTAGTCYLESTRVDSVDFKCFPNVQTLDLGRNSLDWDTDWHNLAALTSLTCEAALGDLAGYMDVSQLTELSLFCDFVMSDCSDLGAYSNLEYLRLDCDGYGMEITGISQIPSLKTLIIADGEYVTDFEELYAMTQLKELSIESRGLRDIGFIRDMADLESLELVSTGLMQIGAIADRADTLKCLRLHQNYSVDDYSAVFECTGLEELELYVDYDFDKEMVMPDLSMMPGLRVLALGNYEKFPGLENLTALESLTLMDAGSFGDAGELAGLDKLTNLNTLSLIDMSVEPALIESFAGVTSLETIDLTDTFIWGDINAVFGLPNLKALNLQDADFGLKLDGMPVSESLLELNMTDANVHQLREDGTWDYGAGNTQISLGGYTEFFEHMPNLTVLKVPGQELQDVEFAGNLAQLSYLDITNNYVTDLSPLAGLGQLKVVVCENNPVHDRTGLKNVIVIE